MEIINRFNELSLSEKIQTIFFVLAFIFMVFSFLGWVLEVFFRRFVSSKKWINPGFLKGPYLPIYGTGIIVLFAYTTFLLNFKNYFHNDIVFDLVIILGIGILMTLIELIAGIIFICKMKIKLWDYSNRPLNFKGVICLEFSIIWTILGSIFYFFFYHPIFNMVISFITLDWFIMAIFLMGIFYGVFLIDLIKSLNLGKKISKLAKEYNLVIKYEELKIEIKEKLHNLSLRSSIIINEHIKEFINKLKK